MSILKTAGAMTGMALVGGLIGINAQEKLLHPVSISPPAQVVAKIDTPPLQSSKDLTHGWWDTLGAPPPCIESQPEPAATPVPLPKRKPQLNLPIPR